MENFLQSIVPESLQSGAPVVSAWELVLIGTVIISWTALLLALASIRRVQKQSASAHNLISQMNRDLAVASNGAVGMGQRIIRLERKLAQLEGGAVKPKSVAGPADNGVHNSNRTSKSPAANVPSDREPLSREHADKSQEAAKSLVVPQGIDKQEVSLKVQRGNTKPKAVPKNTPSLAVVDKGAEKVGTPITDNTDKRELDAAEIQRSQKLTPFELAEKLLREGLDADEVANRCGLTPSEAELMQQVQRRRTNAMS